MKTYTLNSDYHFIVIEETNEASGQVVRTRKRVSSFASRQNRYKHCMQLLEEEQITPLPGYIPTEDELSKGMEDPTHFESLEYN